MKKRLTKLMIFVAAGVFVGCSSPSVAQRRSNPIVSHLFTADPSAHVWDDGRLYVYPSTDVAPAKGCDRMDGYHVFSTDDMITWIDHGEILHSRDVEWGRKEGGFMWAPDCAYRNGTYYYYFPHPRETDFRASWKIGVATSQSPTSGFKVQGTIQGLEPYIDPCAFVDDDDQAYFYHGGSQRCFGGMLKENMVEIDGEMQEMVGVDHFHEGAWVFKRNGIYYMIYPDNFTGGKKVGNQMLYAMADKPLGPWTYTGVFIGPTGCNTMHGSVVEYKGQWFVFYHNAALSGGIGNLRSICFDKLYFNDDGTLQMVKQTLGVDHPTFHEEFNFNRLAGSLDCGEYTQRDLKKAGIKQNTISSIQIPKGYSIEIFEKDKFQGTSWSLSEDALDLSIAGCDNVLSSIKVTYSEPSEADNRVRNSSFETGRNGFVQYWAITSTNLTRSTDTLVEGSYALKYTGEGAEPASQWVGISKNKNYELSVWIKVDPASRGSVIFDTQDLFDDTCQFDILPKEAEEWVQKRAMFNSGDQERVRLRCFTSGNFKGTCYWDNISLKVITTNDAGE